MKNKILGLLTLLCMVTALLPANIASVSAYTGTKYGDYLYYKVEYNGEITITYCDKSITEIEIPSEIDGKTVTAVGDTAFYDCENLTNILLPDSLESIGFDAFSWCTALTSISIPKNVSLIDKLAFRYCCSLANIDVAENNANYCSIDGNLFNKEKTTLMQYAIGKKNDNYIIPDGVTKIEHSAFYKYDNLKSINIPESVSSIGYMSFFMCHNLKTINVNENNTNYCSIDGNLFNREKTKLLQYSIGNENEKYEIPNTVITIGGYAFSGSDSLKSIVLSDNLSIIDDGAFANVNKLTNIDVSENNANYCSVDGTLFNKEMTELIQYAAGKEDDKYTIPNGVIIIGSGAFSGCESLQSVNIPDSVITIGDCAFNGCTGLLSVEIPCSVTSIIPGAFGGCSNLINVILPDSLKSISYSVFNGCGNLKSITIPKSITTIDSYAFNNCNNLTDIFYSGTDDEWNKICIDVGNDTLKNAKLKTIYYIKLITNDKKEGLITCLPNEKIKLSDIEKKYMHKVTLYTDSAMTNEFDISTAITGNMTLYVKLGEKIQGTKTTVDADGKSFTVKPTNISIGNTVILALYNGDTFVEIQSKPYTGDDILFNTDNVYTNANVMVWNTLSGMTPICEAENIEIVK